MTYLFVLMIDAFLTAFCIFLCEYAIRHDYVVTGGFMGFLAAVFTGFGIIVSAAMIAEYKNG